MGLYTGSVAYRRYRLTGGIPTGDVAQWLQSLSKHAFRPIDGEVGEERSSGWVSIHDTLDTDFTAEKVFVEDLAVFALRIDKKRIQGKVLATYLQKAERDYKESNNRESITRRERRNLRELVRQDLLKRTLPTVTTYDVAVDLAEQELRFWSLSRGVCGEFQELFESTFDLNLMPLGAFGMASKVLGPSEIDQLELVGPSVFARRKGSAA